ncbi:MAG: phage tail protein I [Oscillospiraceae bacterium]|nr:phage tail protein I [Oscillospiraceae bacterium]
MNEHGLTKENFLRALPVSLSGDPKMVALAEAIAGVLEERRKEIDRLSVYPHVDRLDEGLLDILARDFKVDWWDNDYSPEEKRRTLASSWQVHKLLGTKAAVETAIRAIYPDTQVAEWFDYGGDPYHFKLNINITFDDIDTGKQRRVLDRLEYYKNLRSHLDGVEYFMAGKTALAYAGAVLLSHSGQVSVGLKPDVHWPRSDVQAAAGAVALAAAGVCSVKLPEIQARWPRVQTGTLTGAAALEMSGMCSVGLPRVGLHWPRVKTGAQLGAASLGMAGVCAVDIPRASLRWPRVKLSGAVGVTVTGQTVTHLVPVRPKKPSWPKSTATAKIGVSVLGVYQKITV